uniref:Uncharacterized protein n=1 Tax=Arundo donax TaxID=35708 RepID=A0A0A9EEQ7_ARUDO
MRRRGKRDWMPAVLRWNHRSLAAAALLLRWKEARGRIQWELRCGVVREVFTEEGGSLVSLARGSLFASG